MKKFLLVFLLVATTTAAWPWDSKTEAKIEPGKRADGTEVIMAALLGGAQIASPDDPNAVMRTASRTSPRSWNLVFTWKREGEWVVAVKSVSEEEWQASQRGDVYLLTVNWTGVNQLDVLSFEATEWTRQQRLSKGARKRKASVGAMLTGAPKGSWVELKRN